MKRLFFVMCAFVAQAQVRKFHYVDGGYWVMVDRASQLPCLRFATAMLTLRKCHVYASQVPCLCFMNAMFTIFK